jgi:hypothetical protein
MVDVAMQLDGLVHATSAHAAGLARLPVDQIWTTNHILLIERWRQMRALAADDASRMSSQRTDKVHGVAPTRPRYCTCHAAIEIGE